MRFSRSLKSSEHSLPSPDGASIATILPSKLIIRTTRSLEIRRAIALPETFSASIIWFIWSPSSENILLGNNDSLRIFSISAPQFSANIANPTSSTAKITYVAFGASDQEVIVFSDFGLKVTVFRLATSTSVDINSPKLFHPGSAARGYGYRPKTQHCALLSRSAGKDVISIHARDTYKVVRSWNPDTVDTQGISWSNDGKWIAVVESAGQGHKILFYTGDGYLFKTWQGPKSTAEEDKDIALGAGVKLLEWNHSGDHIAIGDYSSRFTVLSLPSFSQTLSFGHDTPIQPEMGIQIWQEQITASHNGVFSRAYAAFSQTTYPPLAVLSPNSKDTETKAGTTSLSFDFSGTLIATKCENMPTTVWIWDLVSNALKAVLIQHSPVAKIIWHPSVPELLMIRCESDDCKGLVQLWDPSWDSPRILDFGTQLPEGKIIGRSVVRWLAGDAQAPALFFSDFQACILASLSESLDGLPWQDAVARAVDIYGNTEESPLVLVPADGEETYRLSNDALMDDEDEFTGEVDDTFQFKGKIEGKYKRP